MACYHPLLRIENLQKTVTAMDGHKYHPAIIEKADDAIQRLEEYKNSPNYKITKIPCRKCIGCRLDYSKEWANRGYLESLKNKHNYFVTLTYDDDNIKILDEITTKNGITFTNNGEWNGVLIQEHFTKFIHDIRQIMQREYNKTEIKFMGCGEYGGKKQRPHYHIILFNCPLPVDSFYKPRIINKEIYWQNKIIERAWKYGISNITSTTWNTVAYVSRYITKKILGNDSEQNYAEKGQIKEFFRMSRGIGKEYYESNRENIIKNDEIIIKNRNGAVSQKPPKYFDKLTEKENPEALERNKLKRQKYAKDSAKIKDKQTTLTRLQQLAIDETTHNSKHLALKRRMEE